ncbi:MAG: hypothetical protein IPH97_09105 [Ignavibacteriales bacterium]|nr:hypothetical protein [Ignavibacteriales bacterium]
MKNLIFVLALVTVFAFAANAQSKDCCSKEKGETTKVEKCTDKDHTLKTTECKETVSTTSAGLKDGKEVIEKEVVVTKVDKKENCGPTSSCCDGKKEKKVEKEVEKKETK